MTKFLLRLLINGAAFWAATVLIDGINPANPNPVNFFVLALIFGVLNAIIKPILKLLTFPVILLTLGLFTLVINTVLFWLTGWLGRQFSFGFYVDNWWAAFLGAVVVMVIGMIGEMLFRDELKGRRKKRSR